MLVSYHLNLVVASGNKFEVWNLFINFASEDWQKYICSKLKVNNRNIKKRCETCLKLKLRYQAEVNDVNFIIKLNIFHTFFQGFYCLIWLLKMLFISSNCEMFTWNHYLRHLHYLTYARTENSQIINVSDFARKILY